MYGSMDTSEDSAGPSGDSALRALSVKNERGDGMGGGEIGKLLKWNHLSYRLPITNSLSSSRNLKPYVANQSSYTANNQSIVFDIQTGSQSVDLSKSWLAFSLTVTPGVNWFLGVGSVVNVISQVTLTSRSGSELSRQTGVNVWSASTIRFRRDASWCNSYGSCLYLDQDPVGANGTPAGYASGTTLFCQIPLCEILPMAREGQLLPSQLASGARLEIFLEEPKVAFKTASAAANITYTIDKPALWLDTVQLSDAAMVQLSKTSARNGLEYVYNQIHHQSDVCTNQLSQQVAKAVSRGVMCVTFARDNTTNRLATETVDSFIGTSFISQQIRVGSQYFPHQIADSSQQAYAHYMLALHAFGGKAKCITFGDYTEAHQIAAADLERSSILKHSGLAINNSRSLYVQLGFANTNTKVVDTFLVFTTVARAFLSNVAVTT